MGTSHSKISKEDIIDSIISLHPDLFLLTLKYLTPTALLSHLCGQTTIGNRMFSLSRSDSAYSRVIRQTIRSLTTIKCSHVELLFQEKKGFSNLLTEIESPYVLIESQLQRKTYIYYRELPNDFRQIRNCSRVRTCTTKEKSITEKLVKNDNYLFDNGIPPSLLDLIYWLNITNLEEFQEAFGQLESFCTINTNSYFEMLDVGKSVIVIYTQAPFIVGQRLASRHDLIYDNSRDSGSLADLLRGHNCRVDPVDFDVAFTELQLEAREGTQLNKVTEECPSLIPLILELIPKHYSFSECYQKLTEILLKVGDKFDINQALNLTISGQKRSLLEFVLLDSTGQPEYRVIVVNFIDFLLQRGADPLSNAAFSIIYLLVTSSVNGEIIDKLCKHLGSNSTTLIKAQWSTNQNLIKDYFTLNSRLLKTRLTKQLHSTNSHLIELATYLLDLIKDPDSSNRGSKDDSDSSQSNSSSNSSWSCSSDSWDCSSQDD